MFCNNINLHKWTNMINAFATKIILIHKIAPVRICISLSYTSFYYCRYSIRLPIRLWFAVSWEFTQDHVMHYITISFTIKLLTFPR